MQIKRYALHRMNSAGFGSEEARMNIEACSEILDLKDRSGILVNRIDRRGYRLRISRLDINRGEAQGEITAGHRTQFWNGCEQCARIRVLSSFKALRRCTGFDFVATKHYKRPVGNFGYHPHVVRDEK